MRSIKGTVLYRVFSFVLVMIINCSLILSPTIGYAQTVLNLPLPGAMVMTTNAFVPVMLKGMTIHPENPLKFDFIVDSGNVNFESNSESSNLSLEKEANKLVKYFLASLTVPQNELWVNLSPHEKDRIIPEGLGQTELGQDLLAQDYILKQLTASLMYPEDELGSKFWDKIYKKAKEKYGTIDIPVNTFSKVWIIPESASVYEHDNTVYVVNSRLKVLTDADYQLTQEVRLQKSDETKDASYLSRLTSNVIKDIIIPEIEKEVNEGENFAPLRQIYQSLILAKWYKETLKGSLLSKIYVDRNKTFGINVNDLNIKEKIYDQYMQAYKKGVYNYMRNEYDAVNREMIPRKYFSGGFNDDGAMAIKREDAAIATQIQAKGDYSRIAIELKGKSSGDDNAMAVNFKNKILRSTVLFAAGLTLFLSADNLSFASVPSSTIGSIPSVTSSPKKVLKENVTEQFIKYLFSNNVEEGEKILKNETVYVDRDARDEWGGTLLMVCIGRGYNDFGKLLLEYGWAPNAKSPEDVTNLMVAVVVNSEYWVDSLLPLLSVDDINVIATDGATALSVAERNGNESIIHKLKAHGAKNLEELRKNNQGQNEKQVDRYLAQLNEFDFKSNMVSDLKDSNKKPEDEALVVKEAPGGIDLKDIDVNRLGEGTGIQFNSGGFDPIINQGVEGFIPVIINITPIINIYPLLGLVVLKEDELTEFSKGVLVSDELSQKML